MPPMMDLAAFRQAAREGKRAGSEGVFHVSLGEPKAYDDGTRRVRFCFSDSTIDRAGDRIMADGWELEAFNKNPIALWAHDSWAPPIGRASNLVVENDRLMGDIEFAAADVYEFADTIHRLVLGKFINAVSVGFQPIEYAFVEEKDRPWGIDFKRQELLEISVVPVPCNANALSEARAKGIDTRPLIGWAEKVLDGAGQLLVPRRNLEALLKLAEEPARPRGKTNGMNEGDPAAGGAAVATCGRAAEEECGMKDPQECAVHRSDDMDEAKLAAVINAAVKEGVAAGIKAATAQAPRARRRAEGEEDTSEEDMPSQEKALRKAYSVVKAVGDLSDDVADAVDALQTVVDELDAAVGAAGTDDEDDLGSDEEPTQDEKARRDRVRALKRRLSAG